METIKEEKKANLEQRLRDSLKKMGFEEWYCDTWKYKGVTIDMDLMKLLDAEKEDLIGFALKNMAQAIDSQLDVEDLREENKYLEEELSDLRMRID